MEELTPKQALVLSLITRRVKEGAPPTLQELADELGVSSKTAVTKHLAALVKKGYISRSSLARGIRLVRSRVEEARERGVRVPLLGTITAGRPVLAQQSIEDYLTLPGTLVRSTGPHFALRVRGDSMKDAGILDGDIVIVKSTKEAANGDVVAALIGEEVTIKRLVIKGEKRYLKAENPAFSDIYPEETWSIQGKVVGLIRHLD
ncbi:MAG: transcriptional repressor LexA [candidate division KSB1 bacterium]|nr:transcriptional repressor LexA [candidate division KSB1 bacterium]MDZ7393246.1 transcriptional repressor LexA [candidate division KSB1 bacterium]MDZ7412466.1 transcriptional repressor LexA [candidate division KSB1 bacterium]